MKLYVASSWRNPVHPSVVEVLLEAGHEVYDFRNPPGGTGFSWREVDPGEPRQAFAGAPLTIPTKGTDLVSPERYQQHLKDLAKKGQTGYIPAGIAQTEHEKNAETNRTKN